MRAVRVRITEKRPFLRFAEKRKNGQQSFFRYINTPKWLVPVNYLGKGNFFLLTTFPGRGRNMVRIKKWVFFFGPKFSVFGPKIRFLIWDRDFCQWTVCSPRRPGRFGAFGSIFRLFVTELWPFLWGDPSDAAKSLTPPHYGTLSDSR